MVYIVTSLIVAALSSEAGTARAQTWLSEQNPGSLIIKDWTITELSSAFALKLRTGQVTPAQRVAALALFGRLVAESFTVLAVTGAQVRMAAKFVDQHLLELRAGDALHLATASDHGATLHTLDRRLADAGQPRQIGRSRQLADAEDDPRIKFASKAIKSATLCDV